LVDDQQVIDIGVVDRYLVQVSVLVCALLVVCWFADCAKGYVAGCTWHMYIVLTSDADKHDAPVVHGAEPHASLVDVTSTIRNLTITGIKMDDEVDCVIEWEGPHLSWIVNTWERVLMSAARWGGRA